MPVGDDDPRMGRGDTLLNAAIGAAVTLLTSFLGVSPVLGGGVAGYLQEESRQRGALVGALCGALASIPIAGLLMLVFVLGIAVPFADPGLALGGLGIVVVVVIVSVLVAAWNVALGAVGGYLGTYLREEYDEPGDGGANGRSRHQ